ncbi:unnamed protein product [Schistosoma margrebowiei]|uniref:DUF4515 domain-containing protein n=1 Tax=Schistosoma margrebowiei TaxID=48269 RepID=A0AA85AK63_9TREM|nr:unnamed protein product [Schistosoma margrebowiei]
MSSIPRVSNDLMSSPEDDIFVDKGELLREEYANLNNEIEAISEEILDIQSELILTEHSIQEQEVKNNEYNSYLEKKQSKRLKNTITLEDYYLFTVNELERDRDEMLTMFAKKKSELQDVLLQEKKLLKHVKEELVSTADIQLIRQKQEAEIERLEKEIRATRNYQSEKLQQFKETSKQKHLELEKEAKTILDNVTEKSKKISNKLIVEHVNKICKENEELYKDILNKSELIKAMEAEKSNLEKKNEEVRHNQVFSKDLEYVEYKRREGLSQLKSLSTQK